MVAAAVRSSVIGDFLRACYPELSLREGQERSSVIATDSQTVELLELWAIMDSEGRESLLSLIRIGQERPSENAPATG